MHLQNGIEQFDGISTAVRLTGASNVVSGCTWFKTMLMASSKAKSG